MLFASASTMMTTRSETILIYNVINPAWYRVARAFFFQNRYSQLYVGKPHWRNSTEGKAMYDAKSLRRHVSEYFQWAVFYFIIIVYLLVFSANSEMAGCISRLVNNTLPKYCREYRADCAGCVQSGRDFPTLCEGWNKVNYHSPKNSDKGN